MVFVLLKNCLLPANGWRRKPIDASIDSAKAYGYGGVSATTGPGHVPGMTDAGETRAAVWNLERQPLLHGVPPSRASICSSASSAFSASSSISSSASSSTTTGEDDEEDYNKPTPFFTPRVLSDIVVGLSDGLTVPFALTAGLASFNDTRVVIYGGLAEVIAGSVSMGLGGWLAARGEGEYYSAVVERTDRMIDDYQRHRNQSLCSEARAPHSLEDLITRIFTSPYLLPASAVAPITSHILSPAYPREKLHAFLMQFHHQLPPPTPHRAAISAVAIGGGYFFGGFVPLIPYLLVEREEVTLGLMWSVAVMAVCLAAFGAWRGVVVEGEDEDGNVESTMDEEVGDDVESGEKRKRKNEWFGRTWRRAGKGAAEMVVVGGMAAGGAMLVVKLLTGG